MTLLIYMISLISTINPSINEITLTWFLSTGVKGKLDVSSFKAKNRVFEFDYQKMNTFESIWCSKKWSSNLFNEWFSKCGEDLLVSMLDVCSFEANNQVLVAEHVWVRSMFKNKVLKNLYCQLKWIVFNICALNPRCSTFFKWLKDQNLKVLS